MINFKKAYKSGIVWILALSVILLPIVSVQAGPARFVDNLRVRMGGFERVIKILKKQYPYLGQVAYIDNKAYQKLIEIINYNRDEFS